MFVSITRGDRSYQVQVLLETECECEYFQTICTVPLRPGLGRTGSQQFYIKTFQQTGDWRAVTVPLGHTYSGRWEWLWLSLSHHVTYVVSPGSSFFQRKNMNNQSSEVSKNFFHSAICFNIFRYTHQDYIDITFHNNIFLDMLSIVKHG